MNADETPPVGAVAGRDPRLDHDRRDPPQLSRGRGGGVHAQAHWPCAHCGGALREPLTMAAMRHRTPRAVLDAFRARSSAASSATTHVAAAGVKVARAVASAERAPVASRVVPWPRRLRVRFGGETSPTERRDPPARAPLPAVFWFPGRDVRCDLLEPSSWTPSRRTGARRRTGPARRRRARGRERGLDLPGAARRSPDCAGTSRSTSTRWMRGKRSRSASTSRARSVPPGRRAAQFAARRRGGRRRCGRRDAAARAARRDGLITRYYVRLADVERDLLEP